MSGQLRRNTSHRFDHLWIIGAATVAGVAIIIAVCELIWILV